MGVLPLQFVDGANAASLGLTGRETFEVVGVKGGAAKDVTVVATADDGKKTEFKARVRIDTPKELDYYRHGGILQYVLRSLVGKGLAA
jgi:aconitate hydratase